MPKNAQSSPRLGKLTMSDLRREMAQRQRSVGTLQRRRDRIMKKVHALDTMIEDFGGSAVGMNGIAGRRRARNNMTLPDALAKVLKGKTMSVTDAADAVRKAGYNSNAASFKIMVNAALINSGKFKRVKRGQYTAKA